MKLAILIFTLLFGSQAFAGYTKLAECEGRTAENMNVNLVIFVDDEDDSMGYLMARVVDFWDYMADTSVDWETSDGYPRIHENEFDLDVVISDENKSVDDVVIDEFYVERLECEYTPKN